MTLGSKGVSLRDDTVWKRLSPANSRLHLCRNHAPASPIAPNVSVKAFT